MSEWIIQEKEKNNIDDCEYQHKLSIESNWIVETFVPFAVVVVVVFPASSRREKKAELIYFSSFASFRINAIDKEPLFFSIHRDL